jgi:hypothetical protein
MQVGRKEVREGRRVCYDNCNVLIVVVVVVMVLFVLRISLLSRSSSARTFEVSSGGLLITRDIRSLNQFLRLSSTW